MKSERPDSEANLPPRQIYLSLAPADLTGRPLRIDVQLNPRAWRLVREDLDGSLKPGCIMVPEDAKESMMTDGLVLDDQFWIVDCKEGFEYFRGAQEISMAEF
jgi:hypothetical protein